MHSIGGGPWLITLGGWQIISFLSQDTTLLPGSVILTGTPFGVGLGLKPQRWLKPGETVTVRPLRKCSKSAAGL